MPSSWLLTTHPPLTLFAGVVSPRINSQTTHLLSTQDEFDKNTDTITRAKARQLPIVSLDWILDSNVSSHASSVLTDVNESSDAHLSFSFLNVVSLLHQKEGKALSTNKYAFASSRTSSPKAVTALKEEKKSGVTESSIFHSAARPRQRKGQFFSVRPVGKGGRIGPAADKGTLQQSTGEIEFEKQFKSKTGFHFAARRTAVPKPGKYYWLDIARGGEDDDENGVGDDDNDQQGGQTDDGGVYDQDQKAVSSASPSRAPTTSPKKRRLSPQEVPSKLSRPVQELAKLIFNQALFDATLAEMNYDAKKQPLGSLSKHTIEKGMEKLTLLSDAIKQGTMDNIDALSDAYYSLIPHIFSRKTRPVPIDNMDIVRNELDILSTLSEMKVGFKLMHNLDDSSTNRLDARIEGLKLSTLEPLERSTNEYQKVCELVETTHGKTHSWFNITVGDIFSIEREGESEHFGKQHETKMRTAISCFTDLAWRITGA
ncbi:hypothetical protein L7F22_057677 [Adiantum nelumboides]|nr:hypothetical protein [Adiantum nelumboides]